MNIPPELQMQVDEFLSHLCPQCLTYLRLGDWPFCKGGHAPMRNFTIQPDDVPGGFTIENMTAEPLHFDSKSQWRAKMKELGLENKVQHKPLPGSDKSPHTSRWI